MRLRVPSVLALAVTLALPSAVQAQGRDAYLLPVPSQQQLASAVFGRSAPGIAASSPVGFGPNQGDVFAGFGFTPKAPGTGESDGSLSVGGGFFNSSEIVGLEVVLTSLSTFRSGFGSRTSAALKAHKIVRGWGVGLGVSNIQLNGGTDADPSIYAAATRTFAVKRDGPYFRNGSINVGLGNGSFRFASAQIDDESGVGLFLSSSIEVNNWSSAIFDFSGGTTNLGLSFVPFGKLPLVMTATMSDLTGEFGDKARLGLGAGMSWKY